MPRQRVIAAVMALCVVVSACGNKGDGQAAPGDKKGDTSPSTMTSGGPTAPLTGLPLDDEAIRNRPLLTVKIDNSPEARPQFGIDQADVIVEEKVEGGISRFMALFQSHDADRVGPVRSLRSTDAKWLKPEGGMIAYSGGIPEVRALLKPAGITDIGADTYGVKYYKRRSDRPFEHSMYINTSVSRDLTPKDAAPAKALFTYLNTGETFGGATATPVASVSLRMASSPTATFFDWTWDPVANAFKRGTNAKAHDIEGQGQIAMTNVIVQFTPYSNTPWRDRANSPVDEADVVGTGEAWVLSGGKIVKATWNRPSESDITTYVDSAGAPIKLQPGKTWLSLVPPGQQNEIR